MLNRIMLNRALLIRTAGIQCTILSNLYYLTVRRND